MKKIIWIILCVASFNISFAIPNEEVECNSMGVCQFKSPIRMGEDTLKLHYLTYVLKTHSIIAIYDTVSPYYYKDSFSARQHHVLNVIQDGHHEYNNYWPFTSAEYLMCNGVIVGYETSHEYFEHFPGETETDKCKFRLR